MSIQVLVTWNNSGDIEDRLNKQLPDLFQYFCELDPVGSLPHVQC